jgi:hypothetical protein
MPLYSKVSGPKMVDPLLTVLFRRECGELRETKQLKLLWLHQRSTQHREKAL